MAKIKVKSAKEIELIRDAGALAAETLIRAGEMCKPGVSTLEIDEFIGDYTRQHKGISACMGYHGYPRYACISINEVVCHGIPSAQTILKDGDIVNIDITTILSGYHGDTSAMFCVGKVAPTGTTSAVPSRTSPTNTASASSRTTAATASAAVSTKNRPCCTSATTNAARSSKSATSSPSNR